MFSLDKEDLSGNFLHVDGVETRCPVLAQPVPPVVRVHPEVVERTAEDLERQPVQVKGVPLSSLWIEGYKMNVHCKCQLISDIIGSNYHGSRRQHIT